jgi:hypothetical protein
MPAATFSDSLEAGAYGEFKVPLSFQIAATDPACGTQSRSALAGHFKNSVKMHRAESSLAFHD